jgi:uncharacterized protein YacL
LIDEQPAHQEMEDRMSSPTSGSNPQEPERKGIVKQVLIWSVLGGMLGGLFGSHAVSFWWIPELEWGFLGMLSGFFSVPLIRKLSKLTPQVQHEGIITLSLTFLLLPGWLSLNHFFLQGIPALQRFLSLLGLLFVPLLALQATRALVAAWPPAGQSEPVPSSTETSTRSDAPNLLDSSAIIDGRILSLSKTGFLRGRLLVPKCILKELQLLADSPNPDKRIRGKRGLDILSQLRTLPHISVSVPNHEPHPHLPVDQQLLHLAESLDGGIITNDWNLAQIATLQGLTILNINELTYELRPLVLPGQTIRVFIQKEGQGSGQGAAHLDDGTLVIVDNGSHLIGRSVDVQVSRYMQTNTGRMIFASLLEAPLAAASS